MKDITLDRKKSHLFSSTEVSDEDLGLVCRVVWSYGKVCAYKNKDIIPEETTLCGKNHGSIIVGRRQHKPYS